MSTGNMISSSVASGLYVFSVLLARSFYPKPDLDADNEKDIIVLQTRESESDFRDLTHLKYSSDSKFSRVESDISLGFSNSKSTDDFLKELGPLCIAPKIDKIMKSVQSAEIHIAGTFSVLLAAAAAMALRGRLSRV